MDNSFQEGQEYLEDDTKSARINSYSKQIVRSMNFAQYTCEKDKDFGKNPRDFLDVFNRPSLQTF